MREMIWLGWSVRSRMGIAFAVGLFGALSGGCTTLKDGNETAQDRLEPPVPDPKWACLDPNAPMPMPPNPMPQPMGAAYVVPIFDFTHPPARVPNLKVQLCANQDDLCQSSMPVGTVTGPVNTMRVINGINVPVPIYTVVTQFGLPFPTLRLTAPGYLPTSYFLGGPMIGTPDMTVTDGAAVTVGQYIAAIQVAEADMLASNISQMREPTDAIVAVLALDCQNNPAANVTLTLSVPDAADAGVPFTFRSNLPTSLLRTLATDSSGLAGFANIPLNPPAVDVVVEGIAPNKTPYGAINVTIRPGQLTIAMIRPSGGLYGL